MILTHWVLEGMAVILRCNFQISVIDILSISSDTAARWMPPDLIIRLSVCPSVDRIVSALYLQQYSSDLFHIYTSYQATSEGVSREYLLPNSKIWNFG